MSHGAVAFLYISEVCVDVAAGLVLGVMFLALTISMLTFELKIESSLDIHGTIWLYAAFTFIGFIFCLFFMRETRGLSDLEKKTLYSPVDRVAPTSSENISAPGLSTNAIKVQKLLELRKIPSEMSRSEQ